MTKMIERVCRNGCRRMRPVSGYYWRPSCCVWWRSSTNSATSSSSRRSRSPTEERVSAYWPSNPPSWCCELVHTTELRCFADPSFRSSFSLSMSQESAKSPRLPGYYIRTRTVNIVARELSYINPVLLCFIVVLSPPWRLLCIHQRLVVC